jgi:helix-turn-helix protein
MRSISAQARGETVPRLLYDSVAVAKILSLSLSTVDQLCDLGELRPSVTVGNRRLFSVRDLEQFVNAESPRRIYLNGGESELSA